MFEVGFTEIVLIFGIALLVLGPAKLPKLAADIGRWAGRARSMARQLRTQLEQETQFDPLKDIRSAMDTTSNTIYSPTPTPTPATAPAPADDAARAAPAQAADSIAPPAGAPSVTPPPPADATAAAPSTTTTADEPKHG
jgi:sec-independent protein translocase protein TatB